MVVGVMAGGAAALRGEWLALPFAVLCGLIGGGLRGLPGARRFASEASAKKGIEIPDELLAQIEKLCST